MSATNKKYAKLECHHVRQFGNEGFERIAALMADGKVVKLKCHECRLPQVVVEVGDVSRARRPNQAGKAVAHAINVERMRSPRERVETTIQWGKGR